MNIISRNNVKISGRGSQPILFSHGFGCDQHMWRFMSPAFEEDYQVILYDLMGFGQSDLASYSTLKYNSLESYAGDVVEICETLQLTDVIFVGHSVSAMIGILAHNMAPDLFASLVLIGPSPRYINDGSYIGGFDQEDIKELLESIEGNYLGWSRVMAPVIMGNQDRPMLGDELTESFCRMHPEVALKFAEITFLSDNREDLAQVSIPTLVLQCSEDLIAPVSVGKYVHEKVKSSTFVQLQATGHCPNLSAPQETIQAIKTFLSKK